MRWLIFLFTLLVIAAIKADDDSYELCMEGGERYSEDVEHCDVSATISCYLQFKNGTEIDCIDLQPKDCFIGMPYVIDQYTMRPPPLYSEGGSDLGGILSCEPTCGQSAPYWTTFVARAEASTPNGTCFSMAEIFPPFTPGGEPWSQEPTLWPSPPIVSAMPSASALSTDAPVVAPVTAPVAAPVSQPIAAPVAPPVSPPVVAPVAAPVTAPVAAPPVAVPIAAPIAAPVSPPIAAPVAAPIAAPVFPPVTAPVAVPVVVPVAAPDSAPVVIPTSSPTVIASDGTISPTVAGATAMPTPSRQVDTPTVRVPGAPAYPSVVLLPSYLSSNDEDDDDDDDGKKSKKSGKSEKSEKLTSVLSPRTVGPSSPPAPLLSPVTAVPTPINTPTTRIDTTPQPSRSSAKGKEKSSKSEKKEKKGSDDDDDDDDDDVASGSTRFWSLWQMLTGNARNKEFHIDGLVPVPRKYHQELNEWVAMRLEQQHQESEKAKSSKSKKSEPSSKDSKRRRK